MNIINIFKVIILSSLIGSITTLMILIVKGLFKEKLNPKFHYYIWLVLLIKLMIPFGPQTPLSISNIYEKVHVQSPINQNAQETEINILQQIKNTNSGTSISSKDLQSSNKTVLNKDINIPLINKVNIERVLFFIWMLGAVLYALVLFIGNKKLKETVESSIKNINNTHKKVLYNCMDTMNIKARVEISYSTKISTPSLCSLIKPKILIPVSVAENISNEEFKYIVIHELCHLKNKDLLINWITNLLSVVYWFNPILLYGFHKMRQDCEFSCDNEVISYLDKSENVQYGNTMIKILELAGNNKRLIGTTSMVMNSSEIKRRIIMISKYKKMSAKSILMGIVVVAFTGSLGFLLNTSMISEDKIVSINKSSVNNTSNGVESPATEALPSDSIKSILPLSSDVVIYNSHAEEDYPSGIKVTDVGALINDKLIKEGMESKFIRCDPPTEYVKAYQTTRDLITKNVEGYSDAILLDIHRDITGNTKADTRKILFILAENNPHYEENKKFVYNLLNNIKKSEKVKSDILLYKNGISYFNQDLSNNSVVINIGNDMSSDSDIEECINALVSALRNTQKTSSN